MSIGDALAAARRQAGLTITQVSQRTCIRETIVRGIERGDYSACGGDFYARGHIRSIARAVGLDPERSDPGVRRHPGAAAADYGRGRVPAVHAGQAEGAAPAELERGPAGRPGRGARHRRLPVLRLASSHDPPAGQTTSSESSTRPRSRRRRPRRSRTRGPRTCCQGASPIRAA